MSLLGMMLRSRPGRFFEEISAERRQAEFFARGVQLRPMVEILGLDRGEALDLWDRSWSHLRRATADKRHAFRYPVLCTEGSRGPEGRVVVMRNCSERSRRVEFFTDYRSPKCQEIIGSPQVSFVWYAPKLQLQIRAKGRANIVSDEPWVEATWESLSEHQKRDYSSLASPGEARWNQDEDLANQGKCGFFSVVRTTLESVDILELKPEGHQRWVWEWCIDQWMARSVVP